MDALLTDRYELAMLGAYLREGIAERRATFELSVRRLGPARRFLLIAGIDRALRYLRDLRFTSDDIAYLRQAPGLTELMSDSLVSWLESFQFRGDLDVIPEGELAFDDEPILRVEGSLAETQVLETFLLGVINAETRVASKAARVALAAGGRPVFEFGARRGDPLAAPFAARAAWIAGCASSSCEAAGMRFGVQIAGTLGHSYVLAHVDDGEAAAFARYVMASRETEATVLLDTYDTRQGALHAARAGAGLRAVRLDSGDLDALSRDVRAILDAAGRDDVRIIASDDLDEHRIEALLAAGAPIDGFGVGTAIALTPDAPSLGAVYKLVEVEDRRGVMVPVGKRSPAKPSFGGRKQVWRRFDAHGTLREDLIDRADGLPEADAPWLPVLQPVMRRGKLLSELPSPADATRAARERAARSLASLPGGLRRLDHAPDARHPVRFSDALKALTPATQSR